VARGCARGSGSSRRRADAAGVVGDLGTPTYWVPGITDAPVRRYLLEPYNMVVAFPHLHGVHGTVALGPGPVAFAGMGGDLVDDPRTIRMEEALLRYPGWEAEYRLKALAELRDHAKVLLFKTPPAHKGLGTPGSRVLAELIKTYNPRVAVIAGESPGRTLLAKTHIVSPGRIDRGDYALIDLRTL